MFAFFKISILKHSLYVYCEDYPYRNFTFVAPLKIYRLCYRIYSYQVFQEFYSVTVGFSSDTNFFHKPGLKITFF